MSEPQSILSLLDDDSLRMDVDRPGDVVDREEISISAFEMSGRLTRVAGP